jgi:hypothetical protein
MRRGLHRSLENGIVWAGGFTMKRTMLAVVSGLAVALTVGYGSGCQTRREMLENVAKDWCETIRASQIIPVYPLTEDLQPGDVFLVQMSTANQASLYRKRGFLPLDDHRTRLRFEAEAYQKMYFPSYWSDDFGATLPNTRPLRPITPAPKPAPQPGTPPPTPPAEPKLPPTLSEAVAPRAAFPSYSFEVSTSTGIGLALPLQGVPTALGFLNTTRATGSVTIADARTYGVDSREAHQGMIDWASDPEIRSQLAAAVKNNGGEPLYLRVITRVYLTGAVNVTMSRAVSTAADLAAGKAPDVNLIKPDGNVNENNSKAIDALNSNKATPAADAGGRVKFVGASSSSVSMVESFDRLLVIGYVGLDVPVFKGGILGFPVPTFQRLEGLAEAPMQPALELSSTELGIKARLRLVTGGVLKKAGSDASTAAGAAEERLRAANVMHDTLDELSTPDSSGLHRPAMDAVNEYLVNAAPGEGKPAATPAVERESFRVAAEVFRTWALSFIGEDGAAESLDARFQSAFDKAYGKQFEGN